MQYYSSKIVAFILSEFYPHNFRTVHVLVSVMVEFSYKMGDKNNLAYISALWSKSIA